jgi:hypothetical protein
MREHPPYTVAEVAHLTGYSVQTVTRIFENEPGVFVLERTKKNGKRKSYRSIRIPRPVYERVIRKKIARAAY